MAALGSPVAAAASPLTSQSVKGEVKLCQGLQRHLPVEEKEMNFDIPGCILWSAASSPCSCILASDKVRSSFPYISCPSLFSLIFSCPVFFSVTLCTPTNGNSV